MSDPDLVWTHITDEQAAGRRCVMCGRATDEPDWSGRPVGRGPGGATVYACSGGDGGPTAGRDCAEQATTVVPDTIEGLEL